MQLATKWHCMSLKHEACNSHNWNSIFTVPEIILDTKSGCPGSSEIVKCVGNGLVNEKSLFPCESLNIFISMFPAKMRVDDGSST